MLSIVVPVFNEAETLRVLRDQIDAVAGKHGYDVDLVFVDDGSSDESWREITKLAAVDKRVRGIRFRRNFGKAAALSAGFDAARGRLVLTMDADLQDDPQEIPHFLEVVAQGSDVVSGWKKVRHDPWHKVLPSRVFNWLVGQLTGVKLHDHNCGFKCYRREIFREIRLYGELHRFVPVLAAARGWKVGEVVVQHRAREHGQSKYGWLRIPKGFLDLLTVKFLTGYGQRPQHLLGGAGLTCFVLGSLGLAYLTVYWAVSRLRERFGAGLFAFETLEPIDLHRRAVFFYCLIAILLGAQFMLVGFLAALITALNMRDTDSFSVAERVGGDAAWREATSLGRHRRSTDVAPGVEATTPSPEQSAQ